MHSALQLNFLPQTLFVEDARVYRKLHACSNFTAAPRSKTNVLISCTHEYVRRRSLTLFLEPILLYYMLAGSRYVSISHDPPNSARPIVDALAHTEQTNLFRFFHLTQGEQKKTRVCVRKDEKINPPPPLNNKICAPEQYTVGALFSPCAFFVSVAGRWSHPPGLRFIAGQGAELNSLMCIGAAARDVQ